MHDKFDDLTFKEVAVAVAIIWVIWFLGYLFLSGSDESGEDKIVVRKDLGECLKLRNQWNNMSITDIETVEYFRGCEHVDSVSTLLFTVNDRIKKNRDK